MHRRNTNSARYMPMERASAQSHAQALKWYLRSAKQGYALAQHDVAMMYGSGQGVQQDFVEAGKWYRRAALQGHGPAQYTLGLMYYNGQGVRQDNVQAHLWFSLKADGGDAEAIRYRDIGGKADDPRATGQGGTTRRQMAGSTIQRLSLSWSRLLLLQ